MTKTEQLARGLVRLGYAEMASTSRKYRKFFDSKGMRHVLLGHHGALRMGHSTRDSFSLCETTFERQILAAGADRAMFHGLKVLAQAAALSVVWACGGHWFADETTSASTTGVARARNILARFAGASA